MAYDRLVIHSPTGSTSQRDPHWKSSPDAPAPVPRNPPSPLICSAATNRCLAVRISDDDRER